MIKVLKQTENYSIGSELSEVTDYPSYKNYLLTEIEILSCGFLYRKVGPVAEDFIIFIESLHHKNQILGINERNLTSHEVYKIHMVYNMFLTFSRYGVTSIIDDMREMMKKQFFTEEDFNYCSLVFMDW